MKQWTRQPDFIRLIHSYGFWLSIAGVTAVVMGSNLTELEQQWEFRTVDTIMDNFLYAGGTGRIYRTAFVGAYLFCLLRSMLL